MDTVTELQGQLEDERTRISGLEDQIEGLQSQLGDLDSELDRQTSELGNLIYISLGVVLLAVAGVAVLFFQRR